MKQRDLWNLLVAADVLCNSFKAPETDFGNSVSVVHLKINTLLDQPYLKANDKTRLQHYHQHLADTKIQLYCTKTC